MNEEREDVWMDVENEFILCLNVPDGLAVRISGFHPDGPGSTPGQGSHSSHISVTKIMKIEQTYLATKEPLNCKQRNIFIICRQFNIYILLHVPCLHDYLQQEEEMHVEVLPLGRMNKDQIDSLLKKNGAIYYPSATYNNTSKKEEHCRIYWFFKRPNEIYGMTLSRKANLSIKNMYRQYRLIGSSL
jgi:hypothetical protein